MAITASNLTFGFSSGGTTSTTASIAPLANRLVLVTVYNSASNTPTVTGAGGTWVQILRVGDGTSHDITVFRDLSATPGSGALTIDFAAQTQAAVMWSVDQFSNVDTSGTHGSGAIVQSTGSFVNNSTSTGSTVTLAALGSPNNAAYGFVRNNTGSGAIAAGSGFTQLSVQTSTSGGWENAEWALNQTAVSWTWASASLNTTKVAIEIKAIVAPVAFVANPDSSLPIARDLRVPIQDTTRPVIGLAFRTAITPTTFFFPQLNEAPRRADYSVTLRDTTQPTEVVGFPTPNKFFLTVFKELPIAKDVIGVSLRASTAPIWPQAPPGTLTPAYWVQNPELILPDQRWGAL